MKLFTLVLFCLFSTGLVFGQVAKLDKANGMFENHAYLKAADIYESLLGSGVDNSKMKSKLAYCYFKIDEYQLAVETYAEFIEAQDATTYDYYYYAYLLKMVGNYTESDRWMQKFGEQNSTDSRGQKFLANPNYKSDIDVMEPAFSLRNWSLGSPSTDFGGYFNTAENELYFISGRKKKPSLKNGWSYRTSRFLDIFVEPLDEEEFQDLYLVREISTKLQEGPLAFNPDGKTVYFTRNMTTVKELKYGMQRAHYKMFIADIDEDGMFFNEREFSLNSNQYSVGHPTFSKDGSELYFISDKPGGYGGFDLYKVEIKKGKLGSPVNLGGEVNTEGDEMFPFIDSEGKLFFSSDGHLGLGGHDIYMATNDGSGEFGGVQNLGRPINSQFNDFAFTLSKDLKTGFITSDRDGATGIGDIYKLEYLRPLEPLTPKVTVSGKTRDSKGGVLANVKVDLKNAVGEIVNSVVSNENGDFSFKAETNSSYNLVGSKTDFTNGQASTNIGEQSVNVDLVLFSDSGLTLHGIISDAESGLPIPGVHVYLTDTETGKERELLTSDKGVFQEPIEKELNQEGIYSIDVRKDGYYPNSFVYNAVFDQPGQYNVNSKVDLSMIPVSGVDKKVAEIDMIFFDFDKSYIRPDAQRGLDKIVELMNQYPDLVIELGSHCDCRGTEGYNVGLSDRRAKATADYVKNRISNPARIFGKGYGKTRLLNECECEVTEDSNCSEEEHQMNRRSEFRIISGNENVKIVNHSANSFD